MRKLGIGKYSNWKSMKSHGYDYVDYGEFVHTENDIFFWMKKGLEAV